MSLISPAVARLAASRISDPRFSARSRPPTVSTPRTHFCSPLFAPVSSFVQWSVSPTGVHCVTQRSNGHCRFFCSCWKVRHCLRVCVLQKRHVLLIHQGEVVLELETELEPGLLVVVELDRFRSQLQDFCDFSPSSYHSSAKIRKFCVLRDTIDDQRRSTRRLYDVDTCANDLRLEMAHMSQCEMSVLMKVKLRTTEKQACMRIELWSDKHITLSAQVWIEWPVSYKLMPETPRLPQSKGSRYCFTQ